jgi:hypothetical protein
MLWDGKEKEVIGKEKEKAKTTEDGREKAKERTTVGRGGKGKGFQGNCYNFGQFGHSLRNCTTKGKGKGKGKDNNNYNYNNYNPYGPNTTLQTTTITTTKRALVRIGRHSKTQT